MNASTLKKPRLLLVYALGTALLCGAARAEEPVGEANAEKESAPEGWNYNPGEGVSFGEQSIVSAEFSLSFDSKYLTYGLIDNNDPIMTPAGYLTFFDWITVGVSAVFDTTHYGRAAGYFDRRWHRTEIDPEIEIGHKFSHEDFDFIPECLGSIEFAVNYLYENDPVSMNGPYSVETWEDGNGGIEREEIDEWDDLDTQYLTITVGLPDLWFEPTFTYERDIDRDDGTYLNLSLGHTFTLVDAEGDFKPSCESGEDDVLTFNLSVAQGWGDSRRVSGYYLETASGEPLERCGLMDTAVKGELSWTICDYLSLSGYVLYSDYIFDSHTRRAARRFEAHGDYDHSYNFIGGLCLTASF